MKKILLPLLLLPFGVFAQEVAPDSSAAQKPLKWEVGLNNSIAFSTDDNLVFYDDMFVLGRNSVSVYRNFKTVQAGLIVEGGVLAIDGWWLSPQAVVNYKVAFRKFYAYSGGVAGYVREQSASWLYGPSMNGFVSGAQVGGVYNLGKRFGLNLEAGVRFKHMSGTVTVIHENGTGTGTFTTTEVVGYSDVYFPVSVGVRYSF
ncbi:hypothetical protein [Polluticoccus soli]|uniref:hypothetical protein n=1 Tax=Polluticoccus soli TaxID=3034150 RepID=UPI0023E14D70|nr:hypothetical protein [Flavipsychrobacter sp. JY13-12]